MAASYTIIWTPEGGDAVTLCDLAAGWWPIFEQWPSEGLEQMDRLAFGAAVFRQMRGNVSGECVFQVGHSHDSADAAAAWFQAVTALLAASAVAGNGQLAFRIGATMWSYSGATFRRVEPVRMNGVEWWLRYHFGVTVSDPPVVDPS